MSIARRDLLALAIALGAAAASLVVWDYGRVDLGMTVAVDTHGLTDPAGVIVADVTPDGNAARLGFSPLTQILELTTVSGGEVELGLPIPATLEGPFPIRRPMPWEYFGGIAREIRLYEGDFQVPMEAVDSANIATATAGTIDRESSWIYAFGTIDRSQLEILLRQSIWVLGLGVAVGASVWRFLAHGLGGAAGKERAILLGTSAAVPFLLLPVVQVGTPIGIYAGYLVPIALALIFGLSLARTHPDRSWSQTSVAAAVVGAGLAVVFVARYMTSSALNPTDRGAILLLAAAIAVVPASITAMGGPRSVRERAGVISLATVPAVALTLFAQPMPQVALPIAMLAVVLGWQLLPVERAFATVGDTLGHVRASRANIDGVAPVVRAWRDRLAYALITVAILLGVVAGTTWSVMWGVGLAAAVGFAVGRGFLGQGWTDAAVPLAACIGVPVILYPFVQEYASIPVAAVPTALAALSVAHVLAVRHADPAWRARLFGASSLVVLVISLASFADGIAPLALWMIGVVALIPGLPAAFAIGLRETPAISSRLETLTIAVTPIAALTLFPVGTNGVLLGAWLIAVVVWRQFTLNPLMGLARRTQLQRDLAVAAAETERARLAADLHDDALQQLTMLVRTLDEAGNADAAKEAREVANKLRSVVGDLRLPILDDLGAGAALEWLVERVEPLAGGSVKLERSDESRPPANVELAVFRVAQEALTNAIKHGKPPIAVRYDVRTDGRVTLAVDDAGEGIGSDAAEEAPREGHFGLLNMQQRAEQIGALLDVRRWPAGGTRVALEWRPQ
ncbi:MAG: ATP-binding protein [Candidatus Limnocylindria bacterium]